MFLRKKKSEENLRRRFHRLLLEKRKDALPKNALSRPKRMFKQPPSPWLAFFKKFLFFAVIIGIFVGIFYVVFFSSFFTITKVSLEKNGSAVSGSSLAPFLDKLKNKNLLFVNTSSLTKEIEQTFKNEILMVSVKKDYPQRIIVKVDEYPALLNLRVITPDAVQKFVINQIGYSIFENTEQKDLPILVLHTDKPFPKKGVLIDPQKLAPISEAFTKFKDIFGMKITEGEWFKTEREIHLKTEKNFMLWVDLTTDVGQQYMKLKRALPKLDIYHEPLEYIDLRIAGGDSEKVIFKRKK